MFRRRDGLLDGLLDGMLPMSAPVKTRLTIRVRMFCDPAMTPLIKACELGDIDKARAEIRRGAWLNTQLSDGSTALLRAVQIGHGDCARLLVEAGADVDIGDSHRDYPVRRALFRGDLAMLEMLAKAGADLDRVDDDGFDGADWTLAMIAARHGESDGLRVLIAGGARLDRRDRAGMTAAHHAAMDGRADCLRLLIEAGVDIEALDLGRRSPLDIAASRGHGEAEGVIRAALLVNIEREALLAVTRPAHQSAQMTRASRVGEWMARLARFAKNVFAALGPAPMPLLATEPEAAHSQAGQPASSQRGSSRRL